MQLLQHAEFSVKKVAFWAISNAIHGGSNCQIQYALLSLRVNFSAFGSSVTTKVDHIFVKTILDLKQLISYYFSCGALSVKHIR